MVAYAPLPSSPGPASSRQLNRLAAVSLSSRSSVLLAWLGPAAAVSEPAASACGPSLPRSARHTASTTATFSRKLRW
jgi:hypothetical protein